MRPSSCGAGATGSLRPTDALTTREVRVNRTPTPEQFRAKYRYDRDHAHEGPMFGYVKRAHPRADDAAIRQAIITAVKFEDALPSEHFNWNGDFWECVVRAVALRGLAQYPDFLETTYRDARNNVAYYEKRADPLEAQIGDDLAALVLDRIGAAQPLERPWRRIAERGSALVIGLGAVVVLRAAAAPCAKAPIRSSAPGWFCAAAFSNSARAGRRPSGRRCRRPSSCRAGTAPRHWSRRPSPSARACAGSAGAPLPPPRAARLVTPRGLPACAARSNSLRACASSLVTPLPVPRRRRVRPSPRSSPCRRPCDRRRALPPSAGWRHRRGRAKHRAARRGRGRLAETDRGRNIGAAISVTPARRPACRDRRDRRRCGRTGRDRRTARAPITALQAEGGMARRLGSPAWALTLRLCSGKFKARVPIGAAPGTTSGDAQIAQQPIGLLRPCLALVMRPAENTAGVCKSCGIGPTTSMPSTCFSSLICCTARSASPLTSRSAVKPCSYDAGLGVDLGRDTPSLDQLGEKNAARAQPRIGDGLAPQAAFCGARLPPPNRDAPAPASHGDADEGARQIGRGYLRPRGPRSIISSSPSRVRITRIGGLAVAQTFQQCQGWREVGIDMGCLEQPRRRKVQAAQSRPSGPSVESMRIFSMGYSCRDQARCISLSAAVRRRLRLPASAVASSIPPAPRHRCRRNRCRPRGRRRSDPRPWPACAPG